MVIVFYGGLRLSEVYAEDEGQASVRSRVWSLVERMRWPHHISLSTPGQI
jgi:hypothetical protein